MFFPTSAETNVEWNGKLNGCLMVICVGNICTKNIKIWQLVFQVTVENVGDVFWDAVYKNSEFSMLLHFPEQRDASTTYCFYYNL